MIQTHFINQFVVHTDLDLPVQPGTLWPPNLGSERLALRTSGSLDTFPSVACVARGPHGGFLRAYDVGDGILFCAGQLVRLLVHGDGSAVDFEFDPGDNQSVAFARAFAINMAIALCSLLRGDIALHAGSIEIDGRTIGVLAPSGGGKSTLLWQLIESGARFCNDDMTPIRVARGAVVAFPSVSLGPKLSLGALDRIAIGLPPGEAAFPSGDEWYVRLSEERRACTPTTLSALFFLDPYAPGRGPNGVAVVRQSESAALGILMQQTQGLWAVHHRLNAPSMLRSYRDILHSAPLYILRYPRRFDVLPYLAKAIRELACGATPVPPARLGVPTSVPPLGHRPGGRASVLSEPGRRAGIGGKAEADLNERTIVRWAAGADINLPNLGNAPNPHIFAALEIDEDRMLRLIAHHCLAGRFLQRHAIERPAWCTRGLLAGVVDQHRQTVTNSRRHAQALAEIQDALGSEAASLIAVKGLTAFALNPQGAPPRWSGDIDLLGGDESRLTALLGSLGYARVEEGLYAIEMRRDDVLIELHRGYPLNRYPTGLPAADLRASSHDGTWLQSFDAMEYEEIPYADLREFVCASALPELHGVPFAKRELAVLLSAIHIFRHYTNGIYKRQPMVRLVDLCEIRDLARHPAFDPTEFRRLVKRFSARDSVAFAARMAADLLGIKRLFPGVRSDRQHFPQYLSKWNAWFDWDDPGRLLEPLEFADLVDNLIPNRFDVGGADSAFSLTYPAADPQGQMKRFIVHTRDRRGITTAVNVSAESRDVLVEVLASGVPDDGKHLLHVEISGPSYRFHGEGFDMCYRFDVNRAGVAQEIVRKHLTAETTWTQLGDGRLRFTARIPCRAAILTSRDKRSLPLLISVSTKDPSEEFIRAYDATIAIPLVLTWPS